MTNTLNDWRNLACAVLATHAAAGWAATQVLYDPSVPGIASFDPVASGWLGGGQQGAVTTSADSLGVRVVQTGNSGTVGYSNYSPFLAIVPTAPLVNAAFPVLDRNTGYRFTFGLDMDSEAHTGNSNRAGFSVILIGSNPLNSGEHKGIEIGFQSDRIFAQNDGTGGTGIFTAGESSVSAAAVSSAFSANRWNLDVLGNTYTLSLAQSGTTVLRGALRDYSSSGLNAYKTGNFLFVGDNTSSAQADFRFSYAAITTPVPESDTYAMLLAGLTLFGVVLRRRQKAA